MFFHVIVTNSDFLTSLDTRNDIFIYNKHRGLQVMRKTRLR